MPIFAIIKAIRDLEQYLNVGISREITIYQKSTIAWEVWLMWVNDDAKKIIMIFTSRY